MSESRRTRSDSLDKVDVGKEEMTSLDQYPISQHEERKLVAKLDRRILPIIYALYLFACESGSRWTGAHTKTKSCGQS